MEEQQVSYVLAVSRDHVITTQAGRRRADALALTPPKGAWHRISCGDGAKGTPLLRLGSGRHEQAGDLAARPPLDRQAV
jgi:hypothetical protein